MLEAKTLHKLWSCGDSRLLRLLRRGGIESLYFHTNGAWDDQDGWPSSLLQCFQRLKTVRISRTPGHVTFRDVSPRLRQSQITQIPRDLRKLDIIDYYVRSDRPQNPTETSGMLRQLPRGLVWLSFPPYTVTSASLPHLPPLLTYLELGASKLAQDDLKALPTDLQHLILRKEKGLTQTSDFAFLPPGLLTVTLLYDETLNVALEPECIRLLPRELQHLTMDATLTLPLASLASLPPNLQTLRLAGTTIVEDHQFISFALPRSVTHLELSAIEDRLKDEAFEALPPLTAFTLNEALNLSHQDVSLLPRTITDLSLRHAVNIGNRTMGSLPPRLLQLTLIGSNITTSGLERLPRTLTHLDTGDTQLTLTTTIIEKSLPPSLTVWKTDADVNHVRSLPRCIRVYEKPTLFREIGYWISRNSTASLLSLAARALSFYIVYKRGARFLPGVPVLVSAGLRKATDNALSIGIGLLYLLR